MVGEGEAHESVYVIGEDELEVPGAKTGVEACVPVMVQVPPGLGRGEQARVGRPQAIVRSVVVVEMVYGPAYGVLALVGCDPSKVMKIVQPGVASTHPAVTGAE